MLDMKGVPVISAQYQPDDHKGNPDMSVDNPYTKTGIIFYQIQLKSSRYLAFFYTSLTFLCINDDA